MKTLISSLFVILSAVSAQAANQSSNTGIATLVKELAVAMNNQPVVHTLKNGTTARALIEEDYMFQRNATQLDSDFQYVDMATSIDEADGSSVGTATFSAAKAVMQSMGVEFYRDNEGNPLDKKLEAQLDAQIGFEMNKLAKAGAAFGFDNNGSGVCGVSYTTLYVIDVQNKVIYEFVFVSGPC